MNKEILFEDIKCGNLSAFEALFRQYYPSMCVIAGKLVANREVAEDIVQDGKKRRNMTKYRISGLFFTLQCVIFVIIT